MKLLELTANLPGLIGITGNPDTEIVSLCSDTRKTDKLSGSLFFCVSGTMFDGNRFAQMAVEGGAAALVVEQILPDISVPQVQVEQIRPALALLAGRFWGNPAAGMKMFTITGTKGKTTTTYLLKSILEKAGLKVGLIGTIGNMIGDRHLSSSLTTPDPLELHETLRIMADEGVDAVVMEASAHALDMHRLDGIVFEGAAFTNLSQDHLDYFHDMQTYAQAKKKLFTPFYTRNCVFNADDKMYDFMRQGVTLPAITLGIRAECDLYARDIEISENGVGFLLHLCDAMETPIQLQLTGMFNVYNAITAAALGMLAGADMNQIREGLEAVSVVPGRVEVLKTNTPFKVMLDYSHSPAALENILSVSRQFTRGRLIVLFGCGGDRDREKRPLMGAIAGRLADFSILTTDNPRSEVPEAILESIEEGIRPTGGKYTIIVNRRDAIAYALKYAQEGDVVILAGKGHETYQEIKGVKYDFNEKTVVSELLRE